MNKKLIYEKLPKILIVDDEKIIVLLMKKLLKKSGYCVVGEAMSGKEAIEKARSLHPNIILMDISMPGEIDGIKAAEIIQSKMDCSIIFVTAYSYEMYKNRLKDLNYSGYIMKPYDKHILLEMINQSLER